MSILRRFPATTVTLLLLAFACFAPALLAQSGDAPREGKGDREPAGMRYRVVGPFRGGRSLTGAGVPGDPNVYYFGATGGGVWKSTDGAMTWSSVFDQEGTSAIGALAISESDPNMVYVGTGEACIRGNISHGDGVYKSLDGGKTWKNVGLRDTRAVGKLIVHPRNPDIVFVAALGHPFGPNEERGIFRTTDGGKTWQKVLYKNPDTGGIDVAFDAHNPNIVFASLWQARRTPWSMSSGGPGSGLYRSDDGGTTWKEVEDENLPKKPYGKIGVAVAANSERVYALIEAEEGGLYRSDDGGHKWQLVSGDRRLRQRAWYYMHVIADPKDADTVYVLNVDFHKSTDGGRTFNKITTPPHGDYHGLWIDSLDPQRLLSLNDGGATITLDGGKTWTSQENQPTAQIYHVATDNRFPYHLYGAQQDNTSLAIASRGDSGNIERSDWYPVAGGEAGYIVAYPPDPLITYGGEYQGQITRHDKRSGQVKAISVQPINSDAMGAAALEHRFQWTAPILISPHDPNVIYHAGERLLRSADGGMHWEAISPDLTRNDKSKQQISGGPITKDDTGTEYYDTIFALAESPLQKDLLWAGTDDGLLHITRDGGKNWQNITPKDLPEWSRVSQIDASPHDPGTAFVAIDRHQLDDLKPYIYQTHDYGRAWTLAVKGIPEGSFVRAVREDPARKGLLYAGTETGVFVSYDDGANWESLQLNLPTTPVHDLVVKGDDLVLATHGHGFWILDDLSPARQHTDEVAKKDFHLYALASAIRTHNVSKPEKPVRVGENPPPGAVIYYEVKIVPKEISIEILDEKGQRVRLITGKDVADLREPQDPEDEKPKKKLEPKAGLNRFVWDLRYDPVQRPRNYYLYFYQDGLEGPLALPGRYQVKLTVDGKSQVQNLELKPDPRVKIAPQDLGKQFTLLMDIRSELTRVYEATTQIRDLREQLRAVCERLPQATVLEPVRTSCSALDKRSSAVLEEFIQPKIQANEDSLQFPLMLDGQFSGLALYVGSGTDSAPTEAAYRRFQELKKRTDQQVAAWKEIVDTDLQAFQKLAGEHNIHAVFVPAAAQRSP